MSSKTDTVVKLAIVFFVSLLSFSVGTFVGKKYSDNQHQLAALEPQKLSHGNEREVASVEEGETTHKSSTMTDEELSKLAEEFVSDENSAPVVAAVEEAPAHTEKAAAGTHHEESGHKKATVATSTPAPTPAAAPAPTREERLPSSSPSEKKDTQYSVGKFTVQVASFADEAEAQKTTADLKSKGYSAFYIPANIKGKMWYRVSVGQFATQKEAQSYRVEFMTTSKMPTAIVQKITE